MVVVRVLLINPPSTYLENDASYPPTGLMYLAGKIEALGHSVAIEDMAGGHPLDESEVGEADLIGITCVTPNVRTVKSLIAELPDKPILIGGAHPTFQPSTFEGIRNAIPVIGEADEIIRVIIEDSIGKTLKPVYEATAPPCVEEIATPARHLVDLHRYSPGGWGDCTVLYTTRGCPYSCRFCSKISGSTYRTFPISRVLSELEYCMSLGFKRFVFGDDNIVIERGRMKSLLSELKPYHIEYRLNQDARYLAPDVADLAHASGCVEISFGIESGSQKMLQLMNKQTSVAKNEETLKVAKKAGLRTRAYLVVNFPGETPESIKETIDSMRRARPDRVLISNFAPLPGSYVFAHPAEFDIDWMNTDWDTYYLVGKDGAASPCFTTKELTIEQQIANREQLMDGLKGFV